LTYLPDLSKLEAMDKLIHGTAAEGTIRVMAAVTTGITAEAIRRHKTSPTVSAAFGRVLTGTLLLAATFKEFDRLTVKIESSGPVEGIVAEATPVCEKPGRRSATKGRR